MLSYHRIRETSNIQLKDIIFVLKPLKPNFRIRYLFFVVKYITC